MENIITIVHVIAAASLIGLILLQHGKGADMGAAFGSGASGSLFGVSGSSNFLSRATAVSVVVFFSTSLSLAYLASHDADTGSVISLPTQSVDTNQSTLPETIPAASAADGIPD